MLKIVHCKSDDEDVIEILKEHESERESSPVLDNSSLQDTCENISLHPTQDHEETEESDIELHYENIHREIHKEISFYQENKIWHKLKYRLRVCFHSRPCAICGYMCLTLLVIAGLVGMVVVTVLVLVPYQRASQYVSTHCTPISVTRETEERRCSCGKGCSSLYPCLLIYVHIKEINYTNTSMTKDNPSLIYENEAVFLRHVSFMTNQIILSNS